MAVSLVGSDNVQVLTATHQGLGGAKAINDAITGRLDYAVGDRVMQMRNDRVSDYMNGELGRVVDIGPRHDRCHRRRLYRRIRLRSSPRPCSRPIASPRTRPRASSILYVINVLHPSGKRMPTHASPTSRITRAKTSLHDHRPDQSASRQPRRATALGVILLPRFLAGEIRFRDYARSHNRDIPAFSRSILMV